MDESVERNKIQSVTRKFCKKLMTHLKIYDDAGSKWIGNKFTCVKEDNEAFKAILENRYIKSINWSSIASSNIHSTLISVSYEFNKNNDLIYLPLRMIDEYKCVNVFILVSLLSLAMFILVLVLAISMIAILARRKPNVINNFYSARGFCFLNILFY